MLCILYDTFEVDFQVKLAWSSSFSTCSLIIRYFKNIVKSHYLMTIEWTGFPMDQVRIKTQVCTIDEFIKGAASLRRYGITFDDNIDV